MIFYFFIKFVFIIYIKILITYVDIKFIDHSNIFTLFGNTYGCSTCLNVSSYILFLFIIATAPRLLYLSQ